MSNEQCTVTIADIYGAEWWERNKAELDREWEWGFAIKGAFDRYVLANTSGVVAGDPTGTADKFPRIILHRRKPKPPTIESIYGTPTPKIPAGWASTEEFTGRFEVGESWLGIPAGDGPYAVTASSYYADEKDKPRLKIRRLTPTLREVYGVDEVTIPVGWEWTGEWREPKKGDHFQSGGGRTCAQFVHRCEKDTWFDYRLILRERPKKVWFKAEENMRFPRKGDWMWCETNFQWELSEFDFKEMSALCATRHEDIDQTVQVVTQEDIGKCGR